MHNISVVAMLLTRRFAAGVRFNANKNAFQIEKDVNRSQASEGVFLFNERHHKLSLKIFFRLLNELLVEK